MSDFVADLLGDNENGPEDKGSVCYMIMIMNGIGYLMGWKTFLASVDFLIQTVSDITPQLIRCLVIALRPSFLSV
jgi:hypothetical protein